MHVEDAHPDVAAEAEYGPHRGWSTWDSKLEGARFHLIHRVVAADPFDAIEAERLLAELSQLAGSYGYAVADSYHASADGLEDGEIGGNPDLASLRENLYGEDGHEDPYFVEVRASERLLAAASKTEEAKAFLGIGLPGTAPDGAGGTVFNRMHAAFIQGRDRRAEQTFRPLAP